MKRNLMINLQLIIMKIYLVQHGKAYGKSEDPERSLTEEGKKEIVKVVTFITEKKPLDINIKLTKIFQSGKTRAKETAELIAQFIHPAEGIHESKDLEPMANPSKWLDRLRQMNQDTMLVGHLPHLSKLASLLLTRTETKTESEIIKFSNAGIICLSKEEEYSIEWIVTPDIFP
jgi:phosphohistidine phosphatase